MYPTARRAEFDWLRVLALGMLIVFHSVVAFGSWPWHVNDPHQSPLVDNFLDFLLRWRVSLVFIVSGAALMLALDKRSAGAILRERLMRLGVPLVFGILVIVPPQIFFERVQHGQFGGSYADFLLHMFDGFYPNGNLSWNHLWFIPYVLALTAAAIPLFRWLRAPETRRRFDVLAEGAARHHLYWLLFAPLMAADLLLRDQGSDAHIFLGDAHGWIEFATLFLLGGLLARWPAMLAAIQRGRYVSLAVGAAAYAALRLVWPAIGENPSALPAPQAIAWCAASALNQLGWALAATAFITHRFNRGSPALAYLTEAALPVYILHQTLIVYAVFHLHHVHWPLPVKIISTTSFALLGSLAIYEVAIRHSRWLRPLFGVKPRAAKIGPEVLLLETRPGVRSSTRLTSR